MQSLITPQLETFEGPREITEDNVQYWSRHTKELQSSQVAKALKLVRYDCIRYLGRAFEHYEGFKNLKKEYPDANNLFICLPLNTSEFHEFLGVNMIKKPFIKDYNNSEYIIFKRPDGTFECNCQGWQCKAKNGEIIEGGANCSHVLALLFSFKLKRFSKGDTTL